MQRDEEELHPHLHLKKIVFKLSATPDLSLSHIGSKFEINPLRLFAVIVQDSKNKTAAEYSRGLNGVAVNIKSEKKEIFFFRRKLTNVVVSKEEAFTGEEANKGFIKSYKRLESNLIGQ
jgi:hypothetical protein